MLIIHCFALLVWLTGWARAAYPYHLISGRGPIHLFFADCCGLLVFACQNSSRSHLAEPEASVTLMLVREQKIAEGGSSYYKSPPHGTYTLTATKPGFREVTKPVSVVSGEMATLEIIKDRV